MTATMANRKTSPPMVPAVVAFVQVSATTTECSDRVGDRACGDGGIGELYGAGYS